MAGELRVEALRPDIAGYCIMLAANDGIAFLVGDGDKPLIYRHYNDAEGAAVLWGGWPGAVGVSIVPMRHIDYAEYY
jgi:hypothetical protein